MQRFVSVAIASLFVASASAQFTVVSPNGYAATEGGTNNTFPWNRGTASTRIQFMVDSTHFTGQGVTYPIIISQLRYRADAATATTTWPGGTWPSVRIDLATSPVDYLAASATFANNLGADLTTVLNGPVTVAAGSGNGTGVPGPWYITIPLTTNFLYDPSTGNDLTIDIYQDGTGWTGTSRAADHVSTGTPGALGTRIYNTSATALTAPTGTVGLNYGAVTEFTYVPAAGLYPGFNAAPRTGPSGTIVQFTDQSYSSAPGGILAWQWDFNGDTVIDSTLQNPTFQYTTGGNYTVALTVTDQNATQTLTRTNYIGIDLASASFTTSITGLNVQFTDTSANAATWAWDFENDGIVDSNLQNPSFTYPVAGAYNCKLTVTNAYSTDSETINLGIGIIPVPPFGSTFTSATATRGFWFQTPTRFSVVSLQVPDETAIGTQAVALYRLAAAPPVFSASATGGLEFFAANVPSNQSIPCAVSFDAGEFVGVLGGAGNTTTMRSSYANVTGPQPSTVLGQPTTLTRFIMQFNIAGNGGNAAYSQEVAGALSRVFLGISSAVGLQYGAGTPSPYAAAPTLTTTGLPILGQNAVMTYNTADTSVLGLVAAGFGRLNLPTPLGTLLVNGIVFTDVISGGAPLASGSHTYTFAIPNNPALQGFSLNWQGASLVIPTGEFALSNGTEWWLGL